MARNPNEQPDLTNMKSVEATTVLAPASAPGLPTYPASPNPYLRSPLPSNYVLQPDTERQFYQRGSSQYRIVPLPAAGQPMINSTIQGIAAKVSQAAIAAVPGAAPQEIPVNPQTGTQYVVQVSDLGKLDTFSNNAGGIIYLSQAAIQAGQYEQTVVTSETSATISATGTPHFSGAVVAFSTSSADVSQTGIVPSGAGWKVIDAAANGNNASIYSHLTPASPITFSAPITAANWAEALVFFDSVSTIPTLVQKLPISSGGFSGTTTTNQTFGNPVAAGNEIFVFASIGNAAGAFATISASDGVNTYTQIANQMVIGAGHDNMQQVVFLAPSIKAGATTVTVTITVPGGFAVSSTTVTAYEVTLGGTGNVIPTGFTPGWYCYIENTGTGTFSVQSAALIDGSSSSVSLGPNSGLIVAFDGTNWFTERGAGGSGGGVSSLNTLTGALNLTSSGGSVTITPSGSSIDLETVPVGFGRKVVNTTTYNQIAADIGKALDVQTSSPTTITLAGSIFVQGNSNASGTTAFSNNNSLGNTIVVGIRLTSGSGTPTISDTRGNTYVKRQSMTNGTDLDVLWDCIGCAAGANTVTVTNSFTFQQMVIGEYQKVSSFDQQASIVTGSPSNTGTTPSITPANPNALLIGWFSNETANGLTFTPGAGYTQRNNATGNVVFEDRVLAIPTSVNATMGFSSSVTWFAGILSYNLSGAGQLFSGFVQNNGSSTVTIAPAAGLINGAASITLAAGAGCTICTDNANFTAVL